MKNARWMLAGGFILIPVFLFLSLWGCEQEHYRRDSRVDQREYSHYYRGGRWYRHEALGRNVVVASLSIGSLINALPPRHTTIVVEGTPYYHDESYYFRQAPRGGYVVVPAPVIIQTQARMDHNDRGERGDQGHNEGNRGEGH